MDAGDNGTPRSTPSARPPGNPASRPLVQAGETPSQICCNRDRSGCADQPDARHIGRTDIEPELIAKACEGDERAVRALYDRYSPRVHAVVRRIIGDDDLAQDCSQETWIRAIRALPTFRGEARFGTWLHRIAVNTALQMLRKEKTRAQRETSIPVDLPASHSFGDPLLAQKLEAALDQLSAGMREVLILHDVEGYTHAEIGEALGVTAGTSKSQLFKARARMRKLLSGVVKYNEEAKAWTG